MKTEYIRQLPVDILNCDIVKPCRQALHDEAVERYAAMLEVDNKGRSWPFNGHVIVAHIEDDPTGTYYVIDGQHRIEACKRIGRKSAVCDVRIASDLDEIVRAARSSNAKHGIALTRDELRVNIIEYMRHGGATEADTQIALAFGVHRNTIANIRKDSGTPSPKVAKVAKAAKAVAADPAASVAAVAEAAQVSRQVAKEAVEAAQTVPVPVPPAPVQMQAAPSAPLPMPEPVQCPVDERGMQIPPEHWSRYRAINDSVKDVLSQITRLKQSLKYLDTNLGAWHSPGEKEYACAQIDALRSAVKTLKPECLCTCMGQGCKKCGGVGFLTVEKYNCNVPEEERM